MQAINVKNTEKLIAAIAAAEGRAKIRTINADDIVAVLTEVDERLEIISTKTDAIGTIVDIDIHAQHFPNAYKYTPESTQFTAKLTRNGWSITGICRSRTRAPSKRIVLTLTEATKEHILSRVCEMP